MITICKDQKVKTGTAEIQQDIYYLVQGTVKAPPSKYQRHCKYAIYLYWKLYSSFLLELLRKLHELYPQDNVITLGSTQKRKLREGVVDKVIVPAEADWTLSLQKIQSSPRSDSIRLGSRGNLSLLISSKFIRSYTQCFVFMLVSAL